MYKIVTDIDEETVFQLCSKLSISIDEIDITKIRWKAEDTYIKDDILHIPIKAVGYKVIPKKNQLSDAESRQVSEQSPLIPLASGLSFGVHYYYYGSQSLEMPSTGSPDWIPRL